MTDDVIQAEIVCSAPILSAREAEELIRRVAELTKANVDLPAGFRAVAENAESDSLASALRQLASEVERGELPESILSRPEWQFPPYLAGMLTAAARSGDCAAVLGEISEIRTQHDDAWREIRSAITYPAVLFALTCATFLFLLNIILPNLQGIYATWDLDLPLAIRSLFWMQTTGQWMLLAWAGMVGGIVAFLRYFAPKPLGYRALAVLPLIGKVFLWTSVIESLQLLKLLVEQGIPLPEALRLTAAGLRDANVAHVVRRVSRSVAQGHSLAKSLDDEPSTYPASLLPLIHLGERTGGLPGALTAAADLLQERLRARTEAIRRMGPPLLFLLIASLVVAFPMVVYAQPTMQLVGGLSLFTPRASRGTGLEGLAFGNWILLFPLAFALTFSRRMLYGEHRAGRSSWLEAVLSHLEIGLWLAVLLGLLWGGQSLLSLLMALAGVYVLLFAYFRYYAAERRGLLLQLALAAEHRVPLPDSARSRWYERNDRLGRKSNRLAILLEQGMPLSQALYRAKLRLPLEERVAVESALVAGNFGRSLRQSLGGLASVEREAEGTTARMSYLLWTIFVMSGVLTFMMLKIVPIFARMFQEFDLPLPSATVALVEASRFIVNYWFLVLPAGFGLLMTLALIFDDSMFRLAARIFPPLERLRLRRHGAWLLQGMAPLVREGHPIPQVLRLLAERYPVGNIHRRLERVARDVEAGTPHYESLRRFGFIAGYDAALLAAAERNKHLPWAMEAVAGSIHRRRMARLRYGSSLVFPSAIVGLGMIVGYVFIALMMPLIFLIQGLSR
jgi:type II secretory pathway component PulF